jgi:hypothetical protein
MRHIIDNIYISSCADVAGALDKCSSIALIVGDELDNTIPVAIFYVMTRYGQTYETARNYVLTKLGVYQNMDWSI